MKHANNQRPMQGQAIRVVWARVNNLRIENELRIPTGKLVSLCGVSGSGKSSLAFDVLYAEAQRLGRARGVYQILRRQEHNYEVENLPDQTIGIEQQVGAARLVETVGFHSGFFGEVAQTLLRSNGTPLAPCELCYGCGYVNEVDVSRLLKHPDMSVTGGAFTHEVKRWGGLTKSKWNHICAVEGVKADSAWKALPVRVQETVIRGSPSVFQGLIPALEEKHVALSRGHDEEAQREMSYYRHIMLCSRCKGFGFPGVSDRLSPNVTLKGLCDAELVPLCPTEARWLKNLEIEDVPALGAMFTLSASIARKVRFFAALRGAPEHSLVIFDEPTAGMIPIESEQFATVLLALRDEGHSVLVVEHSRNLILRSDWVIVFGPRSGSQGGRIQYAGTPAGAKRYLPDASAVPVSQGATGPQRSGSHERWLRAKFDRWQSFKNLEIVLPLGRLICICGPSGSGKSAYLSAAYASCDKTAGAWKGRKELVSRSGEDAVRRPHIITPEPIGRHAGSTPATYLRVYDSIRDHYAGLSDAKRRHLEKASFSFNTREGMCKTCKGTGFTTCGEQYQICQSCGGARLRPSVLPVRDRERSISDVNAMTVEDAAEFFAKHPRIARTLNCMAGLGLEYIVLGQPSNSLSGGENQRVKLVEEISKRLGDRSLYILDSPCRGIGDGLVPIVVGALKNLSLKNNTVLVADNAQGLAALADWLIVLGPPTSVTGYQQLNVTYQGQPDAYSGDIWEL